MERFVTNFNLMVGIGMIAAQALIAFIILALIFRNSWGKPVLGFIYRFKLQIMLLISLGAAGGSIIYSNIIGFVPCVLCWIQRVFMYPLVFIYGTGIVKRDLHGAERYSIALLTVGTIIATYHTLIQNGIGAGSGLCTALGGQSCTQLYVNEFGYITIPVMSLTTFVLILIITLIKKPKE